MNLVTVLCQQALIKSRRSESNADRNACSSHRQHNPGNATRRGMSSRCCSKAQTTTAMYHGTMLTMLGMMWSFTDDTEVMKLSDKPTISAVSGMHWP
mmetsp:Transcript_6993/g.12230  ORF Transcript_6993/g.12230 Transcript_6993/m.12230 type:complete len:97 (-) Transcript_6993:22-312(-)